MLNVLNHTRSSDVLLFVRRIILKFENIARKSSETPESTKALVDLRNFINESKIVVQIGSKKDLLKSAEYMEFLLRYSTVPGMEILKTIHN